MRDRRLRTVHELSLSGCTVTAATWGSGIPEIVMLHDGLGSISLWGDVPSLVADRTGAVVLAYDRPGHGASVPSHVVPLPPDWLSHQVDVLDELLNSLGIESPLLVGNSDGGTIALLQAAARPASVSGVVAFAAHSYVEQRSVDAIAALRADPRSMVAALERHHDDASALVAAWTEVWMSGPFRAWDIRAQLSSITAPTLIVQGMNDEFATDAMAHDTAAAVGATATCQLLPELGHLLHNEAPDTVVDIVADFVSLDLRQG